MKTIKVTVLNKLGLHTQKANEFLSSLKISNGRREVNGKSIMGVMLMAASQGTELTLIGDGTDEDDMLSELQEMFENKFGEAQ